MKKGMNHDYSTIPWLKTQGIIFNPNFDRWEYYGAKPIMRGGEPQPEFVSTDYEKCITYKMIVEDEK